MEPQPLEEDKEPTCLEGVKVAVSYKESGSGQTNAYVGDGALLCNGVGVDVGRNALAEGRELAASTGNTFTLSHREAVVIIITRYFLIGS